MFPLSPPLFFPPQPPLQPTLARFATVFQQQVSFHVKYHGPVTRSGWPTFAALLAPKSRPILNALQQQIISTKPRGARRGRGGRNTARAQVLGTAGVSPAARARINATTTATKAPAAAPSTAPTDKIIVSNLPQDVNETQIKVGYLLVLLQMTVFADLFHS